jgi:hypothetical protein
MRVSWGTIVVQRGHVQFEARGAQWKPSGALMDDADCLNGLKRGHSSSQAGRLLRFFPKELVLAFHSTSTPRLKGGVHVTYVTGIHPNPLEHSRLVIPQSCKSSNHPPHDDPSQLGQKALYSCALHSDVLPKKPFAGPYLENSFIIFLTQLSSCYPKRRTCGSTSPCSIFSNILLSFR